MKSENNKPLGIEAIFGSEKLAAHEKSISAKEAFLRANNVEASSELTGKTPLTIDEYGAFFEVILKTYKTHNVLFYTDYDCDGMTSSVILEKTFGHLYENFKCISNTRDLGYSPKASVVEEHLFNNGKKTVVIMADMGIVCHEYNLDKDLYLLDEVSHVCILDHHEPSVGAPEVDALIDLKYTRSESEFRELCTAGLTFELGRIFKSLHPEIASEFEIEELRVVAAIGTVTDMVPLVDLNFHIVKNGLTFLNGDGTKDFYGKPLTSISCDRTYHDPKQKQYAERYNHLFIFADFGWIIGPFVNAESKMTGRNDNIFQALRMKNYADLINYVIAHKDNPVNNLIELNKTRKELTKELIEEAVITEYEDFVVVMSTKVEGKNLLGNLANQVIRDYDKPLLSLMLKDGVYVGSMRAPKGCSLVPFIDAVKAEEIAEGGGHEGAGGIHFDAENYDTVMEFAAKIFKEQVAFKEEVYQIDSTLENWQFLVAVAKTTPIGMGIKLPKIAIETAVINDATRTKITYSKDKYKVEAVKSTYNEHKGLFFVRESVYLDRKVKEKMSEAELKKFDEDTIVSEYMTKADAEITAKEMNDERRKVKIQFMTLTTGESISGFWMAETDFKQLIEQEVMEFNINYSRNYFMNKFNYELSLNI